MRARRRRARGFTLLELLVVLGLAALMVSVVGGGAQAYLERANYQQAVREVASQLKQARVLSLETGQPVIVSYHAPTRSLRVGAATAVALPQSVDVSWQPVDGVRQWDTEQGDPLFVFNADGFARGGQLTVLRSGRGVAFGVNWLLGSVEQAQVESAS